MLVLFVCSGNTCRSPLAAAMLTARIAADPALAGVQVASAGVSALSGTPASEGSYLVGIERGLDLSAHRSRLLTPALIDQADLILTMTDQHLARVATLGGAAKATSLLRFAGAPAGDIPDPYGGSITRYREVADALDAALDQVALRLPRKNVG